MDYVLAPYARRLDITIQAGDDRPVVIPSWYEEGNPQSRNLTGWKGRAAVRPDRSSDRVLHTWSTDAGNMLLDANGVTIVNDDSDTWTWERGEYDIRIRNEQGGRLVIVYGFVRVRPLVSRP